MTWYESSSFFKLVPKHVLVCVSSFSPASMNFCFEGIFNAMSSTVGALFWLRIGSPLGYMFHLSLFLRTADAQWFLCLVANWPTCLLSFFSLLLQFFPPLFFSSLLDDSITAIPNFALIVFHSIAISIQWMSICIIAVLSSSLIQVPCFTVVLLVFSAIDVIYM